MPTSNRETLLAGMAAAFAGIAPPDYNQTMSAAKVLRYPSKPPTEILDMHCNLAPYYLILDGEEEVPEIELGGITQWWMRPHVIAILDPDATTPSTTMNAMIFDAKRLVARTRRWGLSNIVLETRLLRVTQLTELWKPYSGFDVALKVRYQSDDDTP